MIVKEISTRNKGCYLIRDLKEDYIEYKYHQTFETYEEFVKWQLDYYKINKQYGLLDYEILEN